MLYIGLNGAVSMEMILFDASSLCNSADVCALLMF